MVQLPAQTSQHIELLRRSGEACWRVARGDLNERPWQSTNLLDLLGDMIPLNTSSRADRSLVQLPLPVTHPTLKPDDRQWGVRCAPPKHARLPKAHQPLATVRNSGAHRGCKDNQRFSSAQGNACPRQTRDLTAPIMTRYFCRIAVHLSMTTVVVPLLWVGLA
ncbi:hypothetical protein SVAN01_00285 [Stagonosporopsis vannaccii]|nr:hypothetical protein SVAN01_00285 [Stagonosporopsis vannaccii]